MQWNHEPDKAVGARLCEPQRVATAPGSAGHRPALRDGRFMESLLSLLGMHWYLEPLPTRSSRRESALTSLSMSGLTSAATKFMERTVAGAEWEAGLEIVFRLDGIQTQFRRRDDLRQCGC